MHIFLRKYKSIVFLYKRDLIRITKDLKHFNLVFKIGML